VRHLIRRLASRPAGHVELCERCGQACDQRCRSDTLLDQAHTHAASARLWLQ
jgi:hypothetical protein